MFKLTMKSVNGENEKGLSTKILWINNREFNNQGHLNYKCFFLSVKEQCLE